MGNNAIASLAGKVAAKEAPKAPKPSTTTAAARGLQGASQAAKPAQQNQADRVSVAAAGKSDGSAKRMKAAWSSATEGTRQNPTVSRKDGKTTRTYEDNGTTVRQVSYKEDGAQVRQTVRTREGYRQEVTTVRNGDTTERTVSTSREVDKPIDEVVPGYNDLDTKQPEQAGEVHGPEASQHGEPEPTVVTSTKRTVQEDGQDPVTLDRFKTYRQFTPATAARQDNGGSSTSTGEPAVSNGGIPVGPGSSPENKFQREGSGTTVAVTQRSVRNGEKVDETEWGRREQLNYERPDGRKLQTVRNETFTYEKGKRTGGAQTIELRGLDENENQLIHDGGNDGAVPDNADIDRRVKGEYYDQLSSKTGYKGPHDVRYGTSWGKGGGRSFQQVGDIDSKRKPGSRTVTESWGWGKEGDQEPITVRRVDKGDKPGDVRVRQQTNYVGSEGYSLEDTTYRRDGSFHSETTVKKDNGDTQLEITRDGKPVSRAALEQQEAGDTASRDQFLNRNPNRQLYETRTVVENHDHNGKPPNGVSTTYTAEGSPDRITYQQRIPDDLTDSDKEDWGVTTSLETPGSDTPQRVTSPDGTVVTSDKDGKLTAEKDGNRYPAGQIPKGDALNPGGTRGAAFVDIKQAIDKTGNQELQDQFRDLDRYPVDDTPNPGGGDLLETAGKVTDVAGTALEIGSKVVGSESSLGNVLGKASKGVGAVGGPLSIINGVNDIQDGDVLAGTVSLVGGVAGTAALGLGALGVTVPGLGWVALGAGALGIALGLFGDGEDYNRTAELQF